MFNFIKKTSNEEAYNGDGVNHHPIGQARLTVKENKEVAKNIYEIVLHGDLVKRMIVPGQFLHIKCGEGLSPLLRRPISICDVDVQSSELTMIYRVEGEGTRVLASYVPGQTVDVLGPLGQGFPLANRKKGDKVVIIGGGVGVPPLYYLSKNLVRKGVQVTHILGFQNEQDVFRAEQFEALGKTYVSTVDGSMGTKGFVTDVLNQWPLSEWDGVYACGPHPMLKAIEQLFWDLGTDAIKNVNLSESDLERLTPDVYLSLEQRMGCGVGACLACVCHTPDSETSYKKVCTDGPVFRLGEVVL